jgi:hypothetical protein
MSPFFRRPSEVTASDEETGPDQETAEDAQNKPDQEPDPEPDQDGNDADLSKIDTVETDVPSASESSNPAPSVLVNDRGRHRDLLLHTLLEDRCITLAIDILNNRPGNVIKYTKNHPDVQALAKSQYQGLSQHLADHGLLEDGPQSDDLQSVRQGYRLGLEHLLLRHTLDNDKECSPELEDLRRVFRANSAVIETLPPGFRKLLIPAEESSVAFPPEKKPHDKMVRVPTATMLR